MFLKEKRKQNVMKPVKETLRSVVCLCTQGIYSVILIQWVSTIYYSEDTMQMVGISILTHSHVELLEKNTLKPMNAKKSFSRHPPLPCCAWYLQIISDKCGHERMSNIRSCHVGAVFPKLWYWRHLFTVRMFVLKCLICNWKMNQKSQWVSWWTDHHLIHVKKHCNVCHELATLPTALAESSKLHLQRKIFSNGYSLSLQILVGYTNSSPIAKRRITILYNQFGIIPYLLH